VAQPEGVDFDAFYAAGYRRVVGHLFLTTGDIGEAEDCVQEAYARAWQRWSRVSRHPAPEAWVRTVAYRLSVSSWRKAVNRLSAHRRNADDAQVPGLTPDHLALVAALRQIPAEQRSAIVLYHLVGWSVQEIAAQTGTAEGTVKARLSRGRKALSVHLSDRADDGAIGEPARTTAVPASGFPAPRTTAKEL
jgi:RNA polymerase sigma-70 factor (ECF subfamily)